MDRNLWIKIRCFLMLSGRKRADYLIRKKVFASVGEGFVFFPRKIPQDPQFICFHNNVVVATDVMFVNHDIIHEMLNGKSKSDRYKKYFECIEIKDNVFIGAKSLIMPGVTLGPDVVVAAGSVVTKSFGGGVVIGGNPARVIGTLDRLESKRLQYADGKDGQLTKEMEAAIAWERWNETADIQ